jgi:hypothetical protein
MRVPIVTETTPTAERPARDLVVAGAVELVVLVPRRRTSSRAPELR